MNELTDLLNEMNNKYAPKDEEDENEEIPDMNYLLVTNTEQEYAHNTSSSQKKKRGAFKSQMILNPQGDISGLDISDSSVT
jgi:hypothetical protein